MARRGSAAFVFTDDSGAESVHRLGSPVRDIRPRARQMSFVQESLDGTAFDRVAIGSPLWELEGRFRYEGHPEDALNLLLYAQRDTSVRYYPDTRKSDYFDCLILPPEELSLSPDTDFWFAGDYEWTVLMRRTDGGDFATITHAKVLDKRVVMHLRGGSNLEGWTFTRTAQSGAGYRRNKAGTLVDLGATANAPRTDWLDLDDDGVWEQPSTLLELAGTNNVRNPRAEGSTTGTVGSGGVLPTNWVLSPASGLAVVIVGTGTLNGVPYVDLRVHGTTSASGSVNFGFEQPAQVTAASGETWTGSVWVALVGGALTNLTSLGLTIVERTAAGALVTSGANGTAATSTLTRQNHTRTLSGGGTVARVGVEFRHTVGSGVAVDATFRLGAPQLVQAAFPQSMVLPAVGTPAATTRPVEVLSRTLPTGISLPSAEWARYTRWVAGMATNGGASFPRIHQIGTGVSPNAHVVLYWADATTLQLFHHNGTTSATANVTPAVARGDTVEAVVLWNGDGTGTLIVSINGATATSATLSGITPTTAWNGSATTYINSRDSGNNAGAMNLLDDVFLDGVPSGSASVVMAAARKFAAQT